MTPDFAVISAVIAVKRSVLTARSAALTV
jgi:hypothetical protein